jgi:hypothetical protein
MTRGWTRPKRSLGARRTAATAEQGWKAEQSPQSRRRPEWCGLLRVEPVEFEASISTN